MIVLTVANCPPSLRGDLTKWLFEVGSGTYVGRVNARVREELWERVCKSAKSGRATMVWNANTEQGLDFRVHNSDWEPIEFDGLKLMMRPSIHRIGQKESRTALSNASRYRMARRCAARKEKESDVGEGYTAINLETTGLTPEQDEIIEFAAIRVREDKRGGEFHALIQAKKEAPPIVAQRTGLTAQRLQLEGRPLEEVLPAFLQFLGNDKIVTHHAKMSAEFLRAACKSIGLNMPENRMIDTFSLAKRQLYQLRSHTLKDVAEHFGIYVEAQHRSGLEDCRVVHEIFKNLRESE